MLPSDPYMLLSYINMKLRDHALSLEEFCAEEELSSEEVCARLQAIGYRYSEEKRAFVAE